MIDLTRTQLIVLTHPTCAVDWRLALFFLDRGMPYQNIMAVNSQCSVVEARNRVVRDIALKSDKEWIIFSDYDHFPSDHTEMFLEDVEADIVGCGYETGNEASWLAEDNFHMGFVRIRPSVFHSLKAPYFLFHYNEDGTKIASCECGHFRRQCIENGLIIKRRGLVGHDKTRPTWHTSG